jgi:hypothetical protein
VLVCINFLNGANFGHYDTSLAKLLKIGASKHYEFLGLYQEKSLEKSGQAESRNFTGPLRVVAEYTVIKCEKEMIID